MSDKNNLIFVSHITKDSDKANEIVNIINKKYALRFSVFSSSNEDYGIEAGQKWFEKVNHSVNSCKIFVVLCTSDSMNAYWVGYEVAIAYKRSPEAKVIPIIYPDLNINDLREPIRSIQAVRYGLHNWDNKLFNAIDSTQKTNKINLGKTDWDHFNNVLREIAEYFNRGIMIAVNPTIKYRNIFDRLIKELQLVFQTNDDGYIYLTRYSLPEHLILQLIGSGYYNNKCIYYMRFVTSNDFEKLLLDSRCIFSPNYKS